MRQAVLLALLGFAAVAKASDGKETMARFTLPSGVTVTIVEAPVSGATLPNCKVDGRLVHLSDYRPSTYVRRITAEYKSKRFNLDSTCMSDAWNGRPLVVKGAIRYFGGGCRTSSVGLYCAFRGVFADGSEAFAAEWNVASGRSHRTVFSSSHDIISLFGKNIDPPGYE